MNDLQFESQFPLPVPGEPEPLGGPHPLGLNSEGGGEAQAPTGPWRAQPAGARRGRILRGSALWKRVRSSPADGLAGTDGRESRNGLQSQPSGLQELVTAQ